MNEEMWYDYCAALEVHLRPLALNLKWDQHASPCQLYGTNYQVSEEAPGQDLTLYLVILPH